MSQELHKLIMLCRRSLPRWIALLFILIGLIFAQAAVAQSDESPVATLHEETRNVVVDVVVTGKDGKAVTGLTRQDFRVFEDGKPQAVNFFEQHAAALPAATSAQPTQALPPDTFANIPQALPTESINVLLVDALNTPMLDQAYVHKQMIQYLASIPPGTRIAVFLLSSRLRIVQGFTEDSSALLAAIAQIAKPERSVLLNDPVADSQMAPVIFEVSEKFTAMEEFQEEQKVFERNQRVDMTLDALRAIGGYLAGLPGRKNLLWFTSSIPLCTFAKDAADCPYHDKIVNTISTLNNAQVSIYPIEAGGLLTNSTMDSETIRPPQRAGVPQTLAVSVALRDELQSRDSNHLTMDQLADATGGKAAYNQNLLSEVIAEDIDNGARYYTLAYTPTNLSAKGKERKIEVKLVGAKYNLAYRRSYIEDNPKEKRAAQAGKGTQARDPLRALMDRGMPDFTELRYWTHVAPVQPQPAASTARAGDNSALKPPVTRYGIDFTLATENLTPAAGPDGVRRGKVEVALIAYSKDGKPLNWMVHMVGLAVRPDQYAMAKTSGIPFHLDIDAPRGDVYLRSGIYDTASSKAGTLEIPLSAVTVAQR